MKIEWLQEYFRTTKNIVFNYLLIIKLFIYKDKNFFLL